MLAGLRSQTEEKSSGTAPSSTGFKEESYFAGVRNYIYRGNKVDWQVHLGFDLSGAANAPVKIASDGRVVHAAGPGIYGNCVAADLTATRSSLFTVAGRQV